MIYLDTHVVIWLYEGELERFTKKALNLIQKNSLFISPIVSLELQYLKEIKRLSVPPKKILGALEQEIGLQICSKEFQTIIEESLHQNWTRDPFDRIIVAQSKLKQNKLISKDTAIQKNYKNTVW